MPANRNSKHRSQTHYNSLEPRRLLAADFAGAAEQLYYVNDGLQESVARKYLAGQPGTADLDQGQNGLELVEIKRGLASTVTRFRQTYQGTPVADAWVTTIQGPQGDFIQVHDQSFDGEFTSFVPRKVIDYAVAEQIALDFAGAKSTFAPSQGELVWLAGEDGKTAHVAWEMTVFGVDPHEHGDFLTFMDPTTGQVISQENRIAHFTTGTGDVFYPNPYQTLGSGVGITDNNDADSAELNNQMIEVTLEGLDEGTGLLTGEFVDLATLNSASLPDFDAIDFNREYFYTRSDDRFEQVVVYHTVDQMNRYFHALGFDDDTGTPNGIRDFPTLANAHWYNDDQSFYSTGDDAIHFGDGGVDDAEDGDIIAHEYGHAIQHNQNASWGGGEMGAMGEGFGDYIAASFFQTHGDVAFQANHAAAVGEWDATSYSSDDPPNLRRVDGNKMYPGDLVGQVHADGEIWSRALWDINQALGASIADQLVLESHFMLPGSASMVDGAEMILLADANINGGANEAAIRQAFEDRGILEPPATIGTVELDKSIYNVGDVVSITVEDGNGPMSSVDVTIESSNGDVETVTLSGAAGVYSGVITSTAGTPTAADGQLQAEIGDTFVVTYVDTDDGSGGTVDATDTAEFADITEYNSTDTPIPITDNNTITSTINVPDSGLLADLNVQLDITHTYDGDLTGTLTAPDGTVITLFSRIGGNGDDYSGTIFDDEAGQAITDGSPPYAGEFRPEEALSGLDGISITGDWILSITDSAGGDIGSLNSWSMFVVTDPLPDSASLEIDQELYEVGDSIQITIIDGNGPATIPVTVTSSGGDTETLTLTGSNGFYSGTIASVAGAVSSEDGSLQVAVGDTVTVSYTDTDDGTGNPVTVMDSAVFIEVTEYAATDLPLDITDNNTTISTITITDEGTLADLDVGLSLTHTYVGDLDFVLTAPDGQQIFLYDRTGGSGNDFTGTLFDDEASQSITDGSVPFTGSFRPVEMLATFDGISITGTWTLAVTDSAGGDEGTLDAWSLFVTLEPESSVGPVTDSDSAANEVDENAGVGTAVGITATASDPGDTVTYQLLDDAGGLFAIDTNSGVVTVNAPLDFETASSHTIEVEATSTDGSTSQAMFDISVLNVDDAVISTRQLFYGGSSFADNGDFDAVATDKEFLVDGQTATFANYSSYWLGINGLVLEVNDLNVEPTLANISDLFDFKVGNDDTTGDWDDAPDPTGVTYESNVGGSTDRVFLTWDDNTIANTWLQITVLANSNTGLTTPDVFYFGSVIGETGNDANNAIVNLLDIAGTRENQSGFGNVGIEDLYDFNRDTRVNLVDIAIARGNQSGFTPVNLITPGSTKGPGAFKAPARLTVPLPKVVAWSQSSLVSEDAGKQLQLAVTDQKELVETPSSKDATVDPLTQYNDRASVDQVVDDAFEELNFTLEDIVGPAFVANDLA